MDELRSMRAMISALQTVSKQVIEKKLTPRAAQDAEDKQGYTDASKTASMSVAGHSRTGVEDERLQKLEQLRLVGKLGEEEYLANKKRILKTIAV